MDSASRELTFVLVMMAFLLIVCVVAVALFARQWRRERKGNGKS
ncbi:MAG TPA: hypothetical protein VF708_10180 [Pyrinomonadaceae bacterium]|jgi:heme/copper-type cytochrome/quinol oxidase subunit 2